MDEREILWGKLVRLRERIRNGVGDRESQRLMIAKIVEQLNGMGR